MNSKMEKYDAALYYEIFVKEEYGLLKPIIQDASCIFDIGGHKGYFSQWCRSINPQSQIHFFEPLDLLYQQAVKNFAGDKYIKLNQQGIWKEKKVLPFFLNEKKTMQSSAAPSFLNPQGKETQVEMIRLDEYLEEQQIWAIDLMKIDIEGMEFELFASLEDRYYENISNIFCEYHLFSEKKEEAFLILKKRFEQLFSKLSFFPHPYHPKLGYFLASH